MIHVVIYDIYSKLSCIFDYLLHIFPWKFEQNLNNFLLILITFSHKFWHFILYQTLLFMKNNDIFFRVKSMNGLKLQIMTLMARSLWKNSNSVWLVLLLLRMFNEINNRSESRCKRLGRMNFSIVSKVGVGGIRIWK